jgi:excisionase family DNA binding protein
MDKTNTSITNRTVGVPERGFATSVEAASFLGITRQGVSKLAHEGKIPFRRFGRALRIPWMWLLEQEQCD